MIEKEIIMTKYAIHTKWTDINGVPSAETMQAKHRDQLRSQTKHIIWFKIDENTHQSVIIFSSEDDAKEENAKRQELRKQTIQWSLFSLPNSVYHVSAGDLVTALIL